VYVEVNGGPWKKSSKKGGRSGRFGAGLHMVGLKWHPALFYGTSHTDDEEILGVRVYCKRDNTFNGIVSIDLCAALKKNNNNSIVDQSFSDENKKLSHIMTVTLKDGQSGGLSQLFNDDVKTCYEKHQTMTHVPKITCDKKATEIKKIKSRPQMLSSKSIQNDWNFPRMTTKNEIVWRWTKYVENDLVKQLESELQNYNAKDRDDMLFNHLWDVKKSVSVFHAMAYYGRPNFLDMLEATHYKHLYNEEVLEVVGKNQNVMFRSSVMRSEQDGNQHDVFWHILNQWIRYHGTPDSFQFRSFFQNILRGKDSYLNSLLLNLVEFERLSILSFIKNIVKNSSDFLSTNDIEQRGEKGQSIKKILEQYEKNGLFCNMHYPNTAKDIAPKEHEQCCKGQQAINIVKDIFYILKNRSVQREKMLAQRENMLIEREQAVTQREERVAQKEQIIGEDFKYQEEKQNELFSLEVKKRDITSTSCEKRK